MKFPKFPKFPKLVKESVNYCLAPAGFELQRKKQSQTWETRLLHLTSLGIQPKNILDGGAHLGMWTQKTHKILPEAQFLLVEPNPQCQPALKQIAQSLGATCLQKALWNHPKEKKTLHLWNTLQNTGASLLPQPKNPHLTTYSVETTTIDEITQTFTFLPDLIKLDLQGAELPALQGAKTALKHASALLIEFGCLSAYQDRTTPAQLFEFLAPLGFQLHDLCDLSYTPSQQLCGGDFLFIKTKKV